MKLKTWKRLKKKGLEKRVLAVQTKDPALMLAIKLQLNGATLEQALERVENLAVQWVLAGWSNEDILSGYYRQYCKLLMKRER